MPCSVLPRPASPKELLVAGGVLPHLLRLARALQACAQALRAEQVVVNKGG
mgnify:CR=1 FL=1